MPKLSFKLPNTGYHYSWYLTRSNLYFNIYSAQIHRGQEQMDSKIESRYIISCSPGAPWYITFIDPNGVERFLPTKKRWFGFGAWTIFNCPQVKRVGAPPNVFYIMDPGIEDDFVDTTPEQVLENFRKNYPKPQDYLNRINSK